MFHSSLALFSEIIVEKGETAAQSNIKGVNKASPSKVQEGLSDGDRMTTELSDIISHFMQKVCLKMYWHIIKPLLKGHVI